MRSDSALALIAFFGLSSAALNCPVGGNSPSGNPITAPLSYSVVAGQPFDITWTPSSGSDKTVTLVLLKGSPATLQLDHVIVSNIPNSGSYTWNIETSLAPASPGSGYGIQIFQDSDCSYQYSNNFGIENSSYNPADHPTTTAAPPAPATTTPATSSPAPTTSAAATTTLVTSSSVAPVTSAPQSAGTGSPAPTTVVSPISPITKPTNLPSSAASGQSSPSGTTSARPTPSSAGSMVSINMAAGLGALVFGFFTAL